ncbi:MAG: creatinine amidohydrolase [Phycisphaerae bacterium]
MSHWFADLSWPEISKLIAQQPVLLLPLAETEEHGPHLPVGCDTMIAERVALAVAQRVNPGIPTYVLPAIAYGYTPRAVQKWPGTFRVRWHVMVEYLADVCASVVEMGFKRLVVVSSHGPHGDVARLAAREVFDRTGVGVIITQPHAMLGARFKAIRKSRLGGACHACEYETSLMMHFGYAIDVSQLDDRDVVKTCNEWVAGDMVNGSGKVSWSTWALQESETGVYGDPSCATAETGAACMETIVEEYARFLKYLWDTPVSP